MSPAKLPRMALSEHPRYSGLGTPARCVGIPRPQTGLQQPWVARFRAFLKREWQQFRGIARYLRLRRDGIRLMAEYTRVAEAMGHPLMSLPSTPQQQQRLDRVHQIRAEMISIRWAFKN